MTWLIRRDPSVCYCGGHVVALTAGTVWFLTQCVVCGRIREWSTL